MNKAPVESRQVFRPSPVLRVGAVLFGAVCGLGAAAQIGRLIHGTPYALAGVLVWLVPVWFAAAVLAKRVSFDVDQIAARSLAGHRSCDWADVLRVEQTRGGFVIVTRAGPMSAGWLRPTDRERLLRAVLQRARLVPSGQPPPTGVRMVYVPRQKPIRLTEREPTPATGQTDTPSNGHT